MDHLPSVRKDYKCDEHVRAPEWRSGQSHCISVQESSLQSLVRIQAESHPAVIGSPIGWHTIGPAFSGFGWDGAEILNSTVEALKDGQVVAVPTDTIYGLACLAQNSNAIKKVYDIKGRKGQKPLAICVGEIKDIYKYCKVSVKEELIGELLPGPVTLVLERAEVLNTDLNPFTPLVGVRIPDHAFMRRLCQMCGEPLALTSANISSHSSTVAVHEFQDLWPRLAVVVDGGPIGDKSRLGSTVVDLSVLGKYRIIRPGCAFSSTVDVLEHKYGLSQDTGDQ
ncbi:yrdC domain-containing protein, mitochondrial isoform X3 [Oncorhynchus keta]|uniref:yrdC domain-containing protein, mitochondrial isoform X3 n=1 Tax=Oncorhynchus keta TaxID=8018 RepID=UPI00227D29FB|nr:yrdC domain-containing protein, mitochondrial isoform X3 [Oncorhynchus keta]